MRKMNYKRRTRWLIAVWILLYFAVTCTTLYYGYARSVEIAELTIRESLTRVNKSIEDMIVNESAIRRSYDQACANRGHIIKYLQDHGLEENVPNSKHLEEYADILDANYIRIADPEGNTAAVWGELAEDKLDYDVTTEEDTIKWLTSRDSLVPAEEDLTLFQESLKDGYALEYQVRNGFTNTVQNEAFSWRALLRDMKFANEAYLIVISGDGTILVHPDGDRIGKSYDALGFKSEEDFLSYYRKPNARGIAYQKPYLDLVRKDGADDAYKAGINILGRGSGYMKMQGMYVICNMPHNMTAFYISQQRGVLIIYGIVSFMALCYILLTFRWMKRHEHTYSGETSEDEEYSRGRFAGFVYDRNWGRRAVACCIIMLIIGSVMLVHAELLSNTTRAKIRQAQAKELKETITARNEKRRSDLDFWYNDINVQTAKAISYTLNRDEKLQNREAIQELSDLFDQAGIYIFGQDGKTRVTNSKLDHVDLYDKIPRRMSDTFLPLLLGIPYKASTPLTGRLSYTGKSETDGSAEDGDASSKEDIFDESVIAYAGVSIRNSDDLCDGCLGISLASLQELWGDIGFEFDISNAYDTALDLASGGKRNTTAVTTSQMNMIVLVLLHLLVCFTVFCCLGVLQTEGGEASAATGRTPSLPAEESAGNVQKDEDWFQSMFGKQRDRHFLERWNRDDTPFWQLTPERQILFIARIILFAIFLWIVIVFLNKGQYLDENSMIRDVVNGGWKKGMNLYALTAAEMIIVVASVLCMALHSLVYFIARFSTPRGETVCHLVYSIITYATVLITLYYTLSVFGVQTSTILKGAGIVGVIITFGAQSTIADILAGMFLVFENVVHVGDYVKVGDVSGIVKNIGVRMTKIQSYGTVISINNSDMKAMQNMSYADSRITFSIKIDNREDVDRVRKIIERELPDINAGFRKTGYTTSDIYYNGVYAVDESGTTLLFSVFCHPERYISVSMKFNEEMLAMFQRSGIRIAVKRSLIETGNGSPEENSSERPSVTE